MLGYTQKPSEYMIEIFRNNIHSRNEFNIQYRWFCQYFEHSIELIQLLLIDIEINKISTDIQSKLQLSFMSEILELFLSSYIDLMDKRYSCSFIIDRSIFESIVRSIWISYNPNDYMWVLPNLEADKDKKIKRFNFSKFLEDQNIDTNLIFRYLSFHVHWNTINTSLKWWKDIWYTNPLRPENLNQMHIEWSINMIQFLTFLTLYFIWKTLYKEWIHKSNLNTTLDVFENILIKWGCWMNPEDPFLENIQQFKKLITMGNIS